MPKKTNDLNDAEKVNKKATTNVKKTASNKSSSSKAKKTVAKRTTSKESSTEKKDTKLSSNKLSKKSDTVKKNTKSNSSKTTKKTDVKKQNSKSSSSKTIKKTTPKRATKKANIIEYYDLPYRYNQTIVKILAQTPTTLFVYWDISDKDREIYIDRYGKDFFENTIPILIVHNKTMNYSFEIEINDFANSWYFNVSDASCDYEIELGRRAKPATIDLPNNYMHIASSNIIEAPNNHILFEKKQKTLFFRNVKDNTTFSKDVSKFEFMNYIGQIYNIYDVYKKIYKSENLDDLVNNPSSKF